jgi:hypothetical protein
VSRAQRSLGARSIGLRDTQRIVGIKSCKHS